MSIYAGASEAEEEPKMGSGSTSSSDVETVTMPYTDDELKVIQWDLRRRNACVALLTLVVIYVLWGPAWGSDDGPMIPPCKHGACDTDMSNNESASVWLGNGCFWHTQYDMVTVEQGPAFGHRDDEHITSLVGYAGGLYTSPEGLVCYHGGPSGSLYEDLGHAEAVQVQLDRGQERAQFTALLEQYFRSFRRTGSGMQRLDPQDSGPPYRNMIGIPGGMAGKYYSLVQENNVNDMPLVEGGEDGGRGDDEDEYQVYIYDSLEYHFYRAEAYHQFHPNVVLHRAVPPSYTGMLKTVQAQLGRIDPTGCPEGGMPGF
jgi:peptide methionine sulfoxide reductase MsrA